MIKAEKLDSRERTKLKKYPHFLSPLTIPDDETMKRSTREGLQ